MGTERRRWPFLRAVGGGGLVLALASLARADAPPDQYNLFNNNSVVIQDLHTGLFWQRAASTTPMHFADATAYCAALSLGPYATGWRVPSYKELMTLVDEAPHVEYDNGNLITKWIDGNAFFSTDTDLSYWTSSVFPGSGYASVYVLDFDTALPRQGDTGQLGLVRCVH